MRHNPLHLNDLLATNVAGGTLVEYKDAMLFEVEFDRGTITRAELSRERIDIRTDTRACLWWNGLKGWNCERSGDVYYLFHPNFKGYAVAPRGVEIPKKPHYTELSNDELGKIEQSFYMGLERAFAQHRAGLN